MNCSTRQFVPRCRCLTPWASTREDAWHHSVLALLLALSNLGTSECLGPIGVENMASRPLTVSPEKGLFLGTLQGLLWGLGAQIPGTSGDSGRRLHITDCSVCENWSSWNAPIILPWQCQRDSLGHSRPPKNSCRFHSDKKLSFAFASFGPEARSDHLSGGGETPPPTLKMSLASTRQ